MPDRRIFFLRHCKTSFNRDRIISGQLDTFTILNNTNILTGLEQLQETNEILIISSPLKRCVDTVGVLTQSLGHAAIACRVELFCELKERNFGRFQGLEKSIVIRRYPGYFVNNSFNIHLTPPDGESFNMISERIRAVIKYIESASCNTLVICSHNHFLKLLYCALKGFPYTSTVDFGFKGGELVKVL